MKEMNSAFLLMVDPCSIPTTHGQHIRIFNLHDGIQQIVGYCIPVDQCVGLFKSIPTARVIKTVDTVAPNGDQLLTKFKFVFPPLNVVPMHDEEFQEMIKSRPLPFKGVSAKNRFYVRPIPQSPTQKRPQFDDSAMNYVTDRFKLHLNPHLVPYRLPDGLDCFIRLELAQHCRHDIYSHGGTDQQPVQRNHQHKQRHHQQHQLPKMNCRISIPTTQLFSNAASN
ncbi:unnamed protein product [Meloidogyne enterolobii]|uniref:Uncharacterized protein n=1 Tax=Meloidogyne enterolobii TaxID=390850 RepID=A0ACB0YSK3_MELEN